MPGARKIGIRGSLSLIAYVPPKATLDDAVNVSIVPHIPLSPSRSLPGYSVHIPCGIMSFLGYKSLLSVT